MTVERAKALQPGDQIIVTARYRILFNHVVTVIKNLQDGFVEVQVENGPVPRSMLSAEEIEDLP